MPATISDYLQRPNAAGLAFVTVGTWVQLVNNATSTAYVSTSATDATGKFSIANIPAGTYTVNTGPANTGPWTATGDSNYIVAAGPVQFDITDFGGNGNGVADNSTALSNVLAAVPATGGTILFPSGGTYVFASGINVNGKSFIRFKGGSPVVGGGSSAGAVIKFTTTSGPLISATTSMGIEFEDLMIQWPNTFNAVVLAFDGTAGTPTNFAKVSRCFFQATGGGSSAGLIISLDDCLRTVIERCVFHNAIAAIQGIGTAGHFSNVATIRECSFSSSTGDISTVMIANPGQNWSIHDNAFELGNGAGNVSIITTTLGNGPGVAFVGNWCGDAATNNATLINAGPGWTIAGNYIGGSTLTTAIAAPAAASGLAITGNQFATHSVGVAISGSPTRLNYSGNSTSSVSSEVTGTPGGGSVILTSGTANWYGAQQINSSLTLTSTMVLQGAERRSVRTPAFATPFTPDPTLGERTEMTLTGALTVNAPSNGQSGMRLEFWWIQNGGGGNAVTYNAAFHTSTFPAQVTTGSTVTIDVFECQSDGTTWRGISRQTGQT